MKTTVEQEYFNRREKLEKWYIEELCNLERWFDSAMKDGKLVESTRVRVKERKHE